MHVLNRKLMVILGICLLLAPLQPSGLADQGAADGPQTTPESGSMDVLTALGLKGNEIDPLGWKGGAAAIPDVVQWLEHEVTTTAGGASTTSAATSGCTPHPPILIDGEVGPLGFILGYDPVSGAPIYRPGSGVVGGTGTSDDPYIIEGWCIVDLKGVVAEGITLRATDAHVVVRANQFPDHRVGILLEAAMNVIVDQNTFSEGSDGIVLKDTHGVLINGNRFERIRGVGIEVENGHDNHVTGNVFHHHPNAYNGFVAVDVTGGSGNRITGNTIIGYPIGVQVLEHVAGALMNNTFEETLNDIILASSEAMDVSGNQLRRGLTLTGTTLPHFLHGITDDNEVGGRPVHYVRGVDGYEVPTDMGQVIVVDSRNVSMIGLSFGDVAHGIQVFFSEGIRIAHNHIDAWGTAIRTVGLEASTIEQNTATRSFFGLLLEGSSGNAILKNQIERPFNGIILFLGSDANHVSGNSVHQPFNNGIYTVGNVDNQIGGNKIREAFVGVLVGFAFIPYSFPANDTSVYGNDISDGRYGVAVIHGQGHKVQHNDLWNHTEAGIFAYEVDEVVDARHNWWGCPAGPSDPACDGVEGPVLVSPWRDSPNTA